MLFPSPNEAVSFQRSAQSLNYNDYFFKLKAECFFAEYYSMLYIKVKKNLRPIRFFLTIFFCLDNGVLAAFWKKLEFFSSRDLRLFFPPQESSLENR
jgi:hypothetical protein